MANTARVVALVTAFASSPVIGQELCDPELEPQEELPYSVRGGTKPDGTTSLRCEGFFTAVVAGEPVQLVSLIAGGDVPLSEADGEISLEIATDGTGASQDFHVRAEAFERRVYYRMDARLRAGQVLKWPMDEVVSRRPKLAGRIGVLAFLLGNGGGAVFPVRISEESLNNGDVEAVLLARRDLEDVRWRFRGPQSGGETVDWVWLADEVFAGETFSLDIGDTARGGLLELRAREYGLARQRLYVVEIGS